MLKNWRKRMPWTKEQHAIYTKEWKERNKEKVAAYNKKYRENNLEKFYAYHKKWKEQNKEHLAAYAKEYQEKNKEQLADYKKEWNIKQYGLSLEDYNNMLDKQNHKCKICLTSFTTLTYLIPEHIFLLVPPSHLLVLLLVKKSPNWLLSSDLEILACFSNKSFLYHLYSHLQIS